MAIKQYDFLCFILTKLAFLIYYSSSFSRRTSSKNGKYLGSKKTKKSRKLCGIAGAGSDQRIHVQDDVLAVRSKPPPTADVQFHPALPYRKVREDCRLGKPIGPEFLHILGAIVPLIKVNKEFARIHDILLALSRIERLALHPNQIEEVQQTFRKKKADEVLLKLELCGILIHIRKGTIFH